MSNTTTDIEDVGDESGSEDLVRDYLLHQLQLNLLHAQWQEKIHAEAVEELMAAKRTMQENEDKVVEKFVALNEQYEQINEIIHHEKVQEMEKYQETLKEIERWSLKHWTTLNEFGGDATAYMEYYQAVTDQMVELMNEVDNQREVIAEMYDRISKIDSELYSD